MTATKPFRKDTVLSRQVGEESMLFDSLNSNVHVINATAGFVWDCCDGTNSIDDIQRMIGERYNVGKNNDVAVDIQNILNHFIELDVIDMK